MANQEFMELFVRQQQQYMQQQSEVMQAFIQRFPTQSETQIGDIKQASEPKSTLESLSNTVTEFSYDPQNNDVFETWYARFEDVFTVDGAFLSDDARVRLLLRKLDKTAHAKYTNCILPRNPREIQFEETLNILRTIFGHKTSLFSRRFKCLKLSKNPLDDYITYAGIVNRECEQFQLAKLSNDQFKCLVFICGLHGKDVDIRTRLLAKLESEEAITLSSITNECEKILTLKADTALIDSTPTHSFQSSVNHISSKGNTQRSDTHRPDTHRPDTHRSDNRRSTQRSDHRNDHQRSSPKTPCWLCGNMHYVRDCPFKQHKCSKCCQVGHKEGFCDKARQKSEKPSDPKPRFQKSKTNSRGVFLVSKVDYAAHRKFVTVEINGVPTKLQLDTASDISIISEDIWVALGSPNTIPTMHTAQNASGGKLALLSQFGCNLQLNNITRTGTCFVTKVKHLCLMGIDWIELFGLWDIPITSVCNQLTSTPNQVLSTINRQRFIDEIQQQFADVFNTSLGLCTHIKAKLYVKPHTKSVFRPKRPVPYAALPMVDQELDRLEEIGVISRVNFSAWAAPIVAIKKANGTIRICGDFSTGLNSVLEDHQYPLPLPDDIFSTLTGGKFFSKIDLADAYLQVMVEDDSKHLLTINTHRGLYVYNRLCFGVKAAPGIFQQAMDTMLAGLTGVVSYLDDLIVVGKNESEHKQNVLAVFDRIRDWGFHVRPDKCSFFMEQVTYLGFVVDSNGRRPDPAKIDAICRMPVPSNIATVRSFLGMLSYYGQFIKEMRFLRAPLDRLLTKNVVWSWSSECQHSFDRAKEILQSDLLLTHFDPQLEIKVAADASNYGIGAVILHRFPDRTEKAIAHASRSLTPAEQNYSQIEKEALALIFAVKKFHRMLHGRQFILCTDHKPLLAIFGSKKGIAVYTSSRLQRWSLTLLAYNFVIEHKTSDKFGHADVLSRLIASQREPDSSFVIAAISSVEVEVRNLLADAIAVLPVNHQMIQKATSEDPVLSKVLHYIRESWPETIEDANIRIIANRKESLSEIDGCVMLSNRIIIPFLFQNKVMKQLHTAHPGIVRMKALARSYVYWPNMDTEIAQFVSRCSRCAAAAKAPTKTTLSAWPKTNEPWSRIHTDFAGPYEGLNFLLIIDSYSLWPEVFIMPNITSSATVDKFRETFARLGRPHTIVSDNGTQYTSQLFSEFCKSEGSEHIRTSPYHPQSNGLAERFVDTFKRALLKTKGEALTSVNLQTFLRCYRTTPNANLPNHCSPAEMMFGRRLRTCFDMLTPPKHSEQNKNKDMEEQFNTKHGSINRSYHPDEHVYVMAYARQNRTWMPAVILERIGSVMYTVRTETGVVWRRHSNQIRKRGEDTPIEKTDTFLPLEVLLEVFKFAEADLPGDENQVTPEITQPDSTSSTTLNQFSSIPVVPISLREQPTLPIVPVIPPADWIVPIPSSELLRRTTRVPKPIQRLDFSRTVSGKYAFL